ncbi:MAG: LysR family transcriptional regulator, partial [Gammaproteobacteria bacterium]|nr:LysR family transcriptional regulator [Gammaproteobacteria bacterium]
MDVMSSMAVFRRVVEAKNFSAVARETNMSQSTVSKHIASLEERLGTKLLNRSTRSLKLTEAGKEYYHHCIRLLNDFQEAEASVGKGKIKPTGTLRMSSSAAFARTCILPHLDEFFNTYPDINIDLLFDDNYVDLVKEGIDLAIRIGPLEDSTLIARKIASGPRVVVAGPEYL